MVAPEPPSWFDGALKLLEVLVPFGAYIFGRATRAQVNDEVLATTVAAVKELQETVNTHSRTFERHNALIEQCVSCNRDVNTKLDTALAQLNQLIGRGERR